MLRRTFRIENWNEGQGYTSKKGFGPSSDEVDSRGVYSIFHGASRGFRHPSELLAASEAAINISALE